MKAYGMEVSTTAVSPIIHDVRMEYVAEKSMSSPSAIMNVPATEGENRQVMTLLLTQRTACAISRYIAPMTSMPKAT